VTKIRFSFLGVLACAACLTVLLSTPSAFADPGGQMGEAGGEAAAGAGGVASRPAGAGGATIQQTGNPLAVSRGNVAGFGGYVSGIGDGLETGPSFGASVAFYFSRNLGIEAGVQRHSLDVTGTAANLLSGGTLDSTIATVGVAVRFPAGDRVAPYVVGGIAYFSNNFDIDSGLAADLGAFNFAASESVDDVLGFQVGGGIDIALGRHFAVFGEARYLGATADTTAGLRDTVSGVTAEVAGEQDLGRFVAGGGVRILF